MGLFGLNFLLLRLLSTKVESSLSACASLRWTPIKTCLGIWCVSNWSAITVISLETRGKPWVLHCEPFKDICFGRESCPWPSRVSGLCGSGEAVESVGGWRRCGRSIVLCHGSFSLSWACWRRRTVEGSAPCPSPNSCQTVILLWQPQWVSWAAKLDVFPLSQSTFSSSHHNDPGRLTLKCQCCAGPFPTPLHKTGPTS